MRALRVGLAVTCLALAGAGGVPASLRAQESTGGKDTLQSAQAVQDRAAGGAPFCCDRKRFGQTAGELALLQAVPWYFNLHVSDDSTAALSLDSWWRNIEQGFEWDPNSFKTNMFMHPFHGAAYYNAARTNGYDVWESSAFAWLGSFVWEFFWENNRPAINDWVNTSAGGIPLGEALFRASTAVWDNRATGAARAWRELTGFLLNPVGGINRLFRGEMTRVGPNPPKRKPGGFLMTTKLGFRYVGQGNLDLRRAGGAAFFEASLRYGNPYDHESEPFDDFIATIQLNTEEEEILGRIQIEGLLYQSEIKHTETSHHHFDVGLHYDYVNNETYEVGGQSISAGLRSRFALFGPWSLHTRFQALGSFIIGVVSEYADEIGRSYDFGSGAGLRAYFTLTHRSEPILHALYVGVWSHSLNGAAGNHAIHFPAISARIPLIRPIGVGVEYIYAARNSFYRDFPDVHRRNPQFRVFATLF